MPTDTKGPYEEVWVVYAYFKPACSVMEPETHWEKYTNEFDALKKLEEWKFNPRFLKADEVKKYKLYRLESPK